MSRRGLFVLAALTLTVGGACRERLVTATETIALRVVLTEEIQSQFIEGVEIYIRSADPADPIAPPVTPATPFSLEGLSAQFEVTEPGDGGAPEIKISIPSNPFVERTNANPAFDLLFSSRTAGSKPLKIAANIYKGTGAERVLIATGETAKTPQGGAIAIVPGQKTFVEVRVSCVATFSCTSGNQAPVVADFTVGTVNEGETRTVDLSATDPDGHAVTFAIEGNPAFVSFEAQANRITIAPGFADKGSYSFTVKATDAGEPALTVTRTVSFTVANVNRPPAFTTVGDLDASQPLTYTVKENERLAITAAGSDPDPDGNTLTFTATGLPTGASLVAASGVLTWTPDFGTVTNAEGTKEYAIQITVTDSDATNPLSATVTATVTVQNVNRSPSFTTEPQNQTVAERSALEFTIAATDPDGDSLTYAASWQDAAPPASLPDPSVALDSSTGAFSWTPGFQDARANPYKIRFTASDGFGGTVSRDVTILVNNTNQAPTVAVQEVAVVGAERCTGSGSLSCTIEEGQAIALALSVTEDPDDSISSLTVSPSLGNSSLVVAPDKRTATFTWTPGSTQGATEPINLTFTAIDQGGLTGVVTVPITVTDVNKAPVITFTEVQGATPKCGESTCSISESEELVVNVAVSEDADESVIALTRTGGENLAGRVVFESTVASDNRTATFSFTPTFTDAGTYRFSFTATDNKGATTSRTLTVNVTNSNRAPTFSYVESPPEGQTQTKCSGAGTVSDPVTCAIDESYALSLELTVGEEDTDDTISLLSMSSSTAPGATFTPAADNRSGTFAWTPTVFEGGTSSPYLFTFSAQDSQGASVQLSLQVTVNNVNLPPMFTLVSGVAGGKSACRQETGSPNTHVCYVNASPGENTLLLQFAASDPDTPPGQPDPIKLSFSSTELPQIGPVLDQQRRVFSFTLEDTTADREYNVVFEAKDNDPTDPKSTQLTVTIVANPTPEEPTLTLTGCEISIPAGEANLCTVRIDHPDPRTWDQLTIAASFLAKSSFSYDPNQRLGTFTFVPAVTDAGIFQVDFTGSLANLSTVRRYNFVVQRSDVMRPVAFPVTGGPILDFAYRANYLYTVDGGILSVYLAPNASTLGAPVKRVLVPGGASRLWIDGVRQQLWILGKSLKVFCLGGANCDGSAADPRQVGRLNTSDPKDMAGVVVRTRSINGSDETTAIVAYGRASKLEKIRWTGNPILPLQRVGTLESVIGYDDPSTGKTKTCTATEDCPQGWRCTGGLCLDTIRRIAINSDLSMIAVGDKGLRAVVHNNLMGDELSLESCRYDAPDGWLIGSNKRRFGFSSDLFGFSMRLSLALVDTAGQNHQLVVVDKPLICVLAGDFTVVAQQPSAPISGLARIQPPSVGAPSHSLATVVESNIDLRVYDDDAMPTGALLDLPGSNYDDVIISGSIGFAASSTNLVALNLATPTAPLAGASRSLTIQPPGRPAYYTSGSTEYLFVPSLLGPLQVFRFPTEETPLGSIALPGNVSIQDIRIVGDYLIGVGGLTPSAGKQNVGFAYLGIDPLSPVLLPTSGFEVPVAEDDSYAVRAVTFTSGAGTNYAILSGRLCEGPCPATPPRGKDGVWLVELTPTQARLVKYFGIAEGFGAFTDKFSRVALNGTTLYRTHKIGSLEDAELVLDTYNVSDPSNPVFGTRTVVMSLAAAAGDDILSVQEVTNLSVVDNVIQVTLRPRSEWDRGAIFLSVDPTDPLQVTLRGQVVGVGEVLAGVLVSATRTYLSTDKSGLLRINLTDLDFPKIDGGNEAPTNAIRDIIVQGNYLVAVEPTSVVVYELFP